MERRPPGGEWWEATWTWESASRVNVTRRDVFTVALLCRSVLLTQRGHCGFWYDAIKHHRVQLMRFALPPNEAADLATLPEIFMNASIPEEPLRGPFGVCYVAFAGTHEGVSCSCAESLRWLQRSSAPLLQPVVRALSNAFSPISLSAQGRTCSCP